MTDFEKAVKVLREAGFELVVEDFINEIQMATFKGNDMAGSMSHRMVSGTFDEEELSIMRELLSDTSCGYQRTTYYHHCCDANPIIEKIDRLLEKTESK